MPTQRMLLRGGWDKRKKVMYASKIQANQHLQAHSQN